MKTTLEMPDELFRRIKSAAAERGQSLKDFISGALREKLATLRGSTKGSPPGFGEIPARFLRELRPIVDAEFEKIDPADWK